VPRLCWSQPNRGDHRHRARHAGAVPGDLTIRGSVVVPEAELSWRFSRSSGPGGQGVNTTDSRVELSIDVSRTTALPPALRERAMTRLEDRLVDGVLTVSASEQRSQWQNRLSAEQKLAAVLAAAIAPPPRPRVATRPSAGARRRRVDAKKRRGDIKKLRRVDPD
jgi:ribosome-associated protein